MSLADIDHRTRSGCQRLFLPIAVIRADLSGAKKRSMDFLRPGQEDDEFREYFRVHKYCVMEFIAFSQEILIITFIEYLIILHRNFFY